MLQPLGKGHHRILLIHMLCAAPRRTREVKGRIREVQEPKTKEAYSGIGGPVDPTLCLYIRDNTHTCMKTISIRDDVYEKLLRLKEEGESFSDVIEKLLEKKGFSLEDYFGRLKDSPALDKIAEYSRRIRESARFRI